MAATKEKPKKINITDNQREALKLLTSGRCLAVRTINADKNKKTAEIQSIKTSKVTDGVTPPTMSTVNALIKRNWITFISAGDNSNVDPALQRYEISEAGKVACKSK